MASMDKFGNPYELVACKDKNGKGFAKGYVEIGNKLYKIEPSEASNGKVDKNGKDILYWVKITAVPKRDMKKRGL